jgi:hypothetical protein
MPNRPSSPRDPLRRGGAAGLVDLWTTQRSVAQSSTTPTAAANGSGQMMCYQNRTSPSAIDTFVALHPSRRSSDSLAKFAAMRRASSRVSNLAAERCCGSPSNCRSVHALTVESTRIENLALM